MAASAAHRKAPAGSVLVFRPRFAFWARSLISCLFLSFLIGWPVWSVEGLANPGVGMLVLAAITSAWLYGLARRIRRATLFLSPQGLTVELGTLQNRHLLGVSISGSVVGETGSPLAWDALRLKGVREEGREAVLELATRRLGIVIPAKHYHLRRIERGLRDFGVQPVAPGSPEPAWPDVAQIQREAADRLSTVSGTLRASDGLLWYLDRMTGVGGLGALGAALWLTVISHPNVAIVWLLTGALLVFPLLSLLFGYRLEVTPDGLAVRTRHRDHGARWEQVTGIEVVEYGYLRIAVGEGWLYAPSLTLLRGPDAAAIRQVLEDVCLLRGILPAPGRIRGLSCKATRLPRTRRRGG